MNSKIDDKLLVELALNNNQEGYTRLLVKYIGMIQTHIYNILSAQHVFASKEDIEDLASVTFNKAFKNLESYNPNYAFSTWLFSIAQNVCIDHLRGNRSTTNIYNIADKQDNIEASTESPEENLISKQRQEAFFIVLNNMKPLYRDVAFLRLVEGFSYEEIAFQKNININTVKTRLHRAKKIIEEQIKNY